MSEVKGSPFRVPVRDLPTHRRIEVAGPFVAGALQGLAVREALEAPPEDPDAGAAVIDVDLYADGTTVFAAGTISGHVRVACGRCVGPADIKFDEKLRVTFLPKSEMDEVDTTLESKLESEEGVELAEGDLDLFGYDGESVDLEPLLREQLILAVPYAPLCKEDCLGLCPTCGADRNLAPCHCEKPVDPRFEALKGLKLPSRE
jgi:uncharacterized protein